MKVHLRGFMCGVVTYAEASDPCLVTCLRCRNSWEYRAACAEAGLAEPPPIPAPVKRMNTTQAVVERLRLGDCSTLVLAESVGVCPRRIRQVCNASTLVERKNGLPVKALAIWGLRIKPRLGRTTKPFPAKS